MKNNIPLPATILVLVIAITVFTTVVLNARTNDDDTPPIAIPKTEKGINLDGNLDDAAWENAAVFDIAYETSPSENIEAPVKTTVYIMYDNTTIYVGFRALDPRPEEIRARYKDRDSLWGDDSVSVTFDTFNDEQRSYDFSSNPLGVQSDSYNGGNSRGMGRHGGGSSWDGIWEAAGQLHDWGYSVEMAIPFNVLRFQQTEDDQIWGFFARRTYPRSVTHRMRNTPDVRGTNCELCEAQKIIGFADIAPGRNVEITPTISAIRQDYKPGFPFGGLEELDTASNIGLSGSWGITPNYTLSAAINPDFSQIEADQLRLTINERFTLRYREKRPFFLEGNEYFTNIHTRMISDPSYGFKLTGREGENSFGFLHARDDVTNLIFPGSQGSSSASFERGNNASVLRYNRDTWNNSTVGLLMTNRSGGDYYNRVYGMDSNIRLTSNDSFSVKLLGSNTQYEDETAQEYDQPLGAFSDRMISVSYNKSTRNWHARFSYEDIGENLRTDLDHRTMVGYKKYSAFTQRQWYGSSDDLYTRLSVNVNFQKMEELGGNLLNESLRIGTNVSGPMQSNINYNLSKSTKTYYNDTFEGISHNFRTRMQPTADIGVHMSVNFGDAIDYYHSREAYRLNLSPEIDINFGRHLKLSTDYSFTRMTVEGEELYTTNTIEGRLTYQFNTRMFLRSIVQFADIRKNQEMYESAIDPKYQSIFSQLLFSYKVNPRTVFYLGYSDNFRSADQYDGIVYDLTQADRTVFFKIGYAWLM